MKRKNPIIVNGESIMKSVAIKQSGGPKQYPLTLEKTVCNLTENFIKINEYIQCENKELFLDDVYLTVRMHSGFSAKSYKPDILEIDKNIQIVGARNYKNQEKIKQDDAGEESKLYFLKANRSSITNLEEALKSGELYDTKNKKKNLKSIKKVDFLSKDERKVGFEDSWEKGFVEVAFHPLDKEKDKAKELLLKNENIKNIEIREYFEGPTFMSAFTNREGLEEISNYNFLRSVQPIKKINLPKIRKVDTYDNSTQYSLPIKNMMSKNQIYVGILDGGFCKSSHDWVNMVEYNDFGIIDEDVSNLEHGSAVTSATIFGSIGNHMFKNIGDIKVKNFKVFSEGMHIYEVIDKIEKIVEDKENENIEIYNISFGPEGSIEDDNITRFTYALDLLAYKYKKLFFVAVGNSGYENSPLNRVQAPSDMINGIGVGAITYDPLTNMGLKRAPYSSIGAGREGCKVKPDITTFGGCDSNKFRVFIGDNIEETKGTSFASPVAAGVAARILNRTNGLSILDLKNLIIHSANHPTNTPDIELGHGVLDIDIENILYNSDDRYTLIYSGKAKPKTYLKLPIPLNTGDFKDGKINIKWTISTMIEPNIYDSDGYASFAFTDTFYPHDKKYIMRKTVDNKPKTKTIDLSTDKGKQELEEYKLKGYSISTVPVSEVGDSCLDEDDSKLNLKWDTVVKREKNKWLKNVRNPYLILHSQSRDPSDKEIEFSVAITVSLEKYKGNLSENILNNFETLLPLDIKIDQNISIEEDMEIEL